MYGVLHSRGVGAMEIVAMDMKLRGMYIARQLSFHGVSFKIEEVPLAESFRETYDKAVALVRIHFTTLQPNVTSLIHHHHIGVVGAD